jgi:hypothetical protein
VEFVWAAMSKMDCHLKDRFRMLSRKGRTALIAVAHSLAVILHRTLASGTAYREAAQPADDRKKERLIRHYVRRLGELGVAVHSLRPESGMPHHSSAGTRTRLSSTRNEPAVASTVFTERSQKVIENREIGRRAQGYFRKK